MNHHVLIIEDEEDIANLIAIHLKREGFEVDIALDGQEGLDRALQGKFSLMLVDWMLPGIDGIEIVKKIRKSPSPVNNISILMITAKSQNEDVVEGLESGADDYLSKPIDLSVMKARVKALLRRHPQGGSAQENASDIYEWNGIKIDDDRVSVTCDGKELKLTRSEYKILLALVQSQGRVLTRDKLIAQVQGEGVSVIRRTIDTHMVALRKKLGDKGQLIESIRGVGYRVNTGG